MNIKGLLIIVGIGLVMACELWSMPASPKSVWTKASAGNNSVKPELEKVWHSETVGVNVPAYLNANTQGGSITVKSHNKNEITVHIFVKKRGQFVTDEDVPVDVSISESKNGLEITSNVQRGGFFWRIPPISVSYHILVPRQTEVRARTSGGPVTASGIDHNVTLITSGGKITAEEISGDVLARTSGGPISVQQVTGNLTARTSGGGIRINNMTGTVNARTSGGPINIDRVSGSIEAHTSGGSITANVRALVNHLTLSTAGGSITARLPRNQGMDITARGGSIQNNLDDLTGEIGSRTMKGSVGGGGIPVELITSGGSVQISYRD